MSGRGEGPQGNREVSHLVILDASVRERRGVLEEGAPGGTWFTRATEPEAREAAA